jgi:hypothetical protein
MLVVRGVTPLATDSDEAGRSGSANMAVKLTGALLVAICTWNGSGVDPC